MGGTQLDVPLTHQRLYLNRAAWICTREHVRSDRQYVIYLPPLADLDGAFWFEEIIGARASAAMITLRDPQQRETGYRLQERPRLCADPLCVGKVAGIAISDARCDWVTQRER